MSPHHARTTIAAYTLSRELGSGESGVVYEALRGNEAFALKLLRSPDVESTRRFRREAAALARLNHPGLKHKA